MQLTTYEVGVYRTGSGASRSLGLAPLLVGNKFRRVARYNGRERGRV